MLNKACQAGSIQQPLRGLRRAVAEGDNADSGGFKGAERRGGVRLRLQLSEAVEDDLSAGPLAVMACSAVSVSNVSLAMSVNPA